MQKIMFNDKLKYFYIKCNPDLDETGLFTNRIYVAVLSDDYHKEIVFEYALRKFGGYLDKGIMGHSFQPTFEIKDCDEEDYVKCLPFYFQGRYCESEKIFLSTIHVNGFPKEYNFMKEWGFKD